MKPQDYEKLGVFYLGAHQGPIGTTTEAPPDREPLLYASRDLTTHALCVGMTGSGKTGLGITLLEEAALDGIPALVIDPKGDLGNLLLTFPDLAAQDFEPWVDASEAEKAGRTVSEQAAHTAQRWQNGLADWGQDGDRIRAFRQAVDLTIYTPGSTSGMPLSALKSLDAPATATLQNDEAFRDRVASAASALLALANVDADPQRSREHILLSLLLERTWKNGQGLTLGELIQQINEPGLDRVGVVDLESFFPAKDRHELALQLNTLLASPSFSAWMEGEALDVPRLLWDSEGKPRLSILSLAHLSESERMFFVTLLLSEVVAWMRGQPGTASLRALIYMDETFGFFPPVANPPCKTPMLTLLKQARAYGVGVVLATQNPVDLDYKGLSNCGTWFLGRLQTERDLDRVMEGLAGASQASRGDFDPTTMRATLAGLTSRRFLLNNVHEDAPVLFETRWAMSYLRGPLTNRQVALLMKEKKATTPAAKAAPAAETTASTRPAAPPANAAESPDSSRPVLPPEIEQLFVSADTENSSPRYHVGYTAKLELHYVHAHAEIDEWSTVWLIAPGASWDDATVHPQLKVQSDPAPGATWDALPDEGIRAKDLKTLERKAKTHAHKTLKRTVFYCPERRLWSRAGEDRGAFTARVQLAEREARDEKIRKLESRYAPKVAKLNDRIRRATQRVEREKSQYNQQKLQTAVSLGSTVLGALFGRRSTRGVTGTLRGAGRAARERGDIARAEENVTALQEELEQLEATLRTEIEDLRTGSEGASPSIETREIAPRKADIQVARIALAWIPD